MGHMRQPTGWIVLNPDLGDRHFRDKGLHVLKSRRCTEDKTMDTVFQDLQTVSALWSLNGER